MSLSKKQVEKIEETLEKISIEMNKIHVTLAVNTKSLEEHMRRTKVNEASIKQIYEIDLPKNTQVIEKILFTIKLLPWGMGIIGTVVAIVYKSGISIF